jgi:fructose-1,6-bisphosphatase/inositol monophosphatase family enzyme
MSLMDLMERVAEVVRETAATVIEPRFRSLRDGEVSEKTAGELVTVADTEAEAMLTGAPRGLLSGVPVIGEEACTSEPGLLDALRAGRAWLVDPLDGTANFVRGTDDWAVMVALVERGEGVASWIWQPRTGRMYQAERSGGTRCNGHPLIATASGASGERDLRGGVHTRFLGSDLAATVARNSGRFGAIAAGRHCAGVEYPAVIEGDQDFALYWRTRPWDHVPAVLLIEEAGGVARRPDGATYRAGDGRWGLLVARDERTWALARGLLDD